jgi:adhesin/invasin
MLPASVCRPLLVFLAFGGLIAGLACSDESNIGPGGIIAVRIVPDTVRMVIGKIDTVRAFPLDQVGAFVANKKVTFASSDPQVAQITDKGEVTAVGLGSAEITAKVGSIVGSAPVFVTPAPTIGVSADTVRFTAIAHSGASPAGTVTITNIGGSALTDLTLGAIDFGTGPTGWVTADLDQPAAPATLSLVTSITGLGLGTYFADLPLISASSSNSPKKVTVALTLTAGAPTTIALQAGDGQTAAVNATVAVAPSVLITDQFGNPVAGQAVNFAVTGGGGSVTGGATVSGTNGVAAVTSWRLGTGAGTNTLSATATGLTGSPVSFTATAVPGAAFQIAVGGGNGQSAIAGQVVATPPSVLVRDQFTNPVSGVSVTFAVATGGGSITGGSQTTNASGVATVGSWTLGTVAGPNSLTATSGTLTGSPVTFTATGTPGPATTLAISAGNNQTATAGTVVPVAPAVLVTDVNGNGVTGVSVTFTVTSGGGSVTGGSQTTNASGVATVGSWRLGGPAGSNALSATSSGLAGSPATFSATGTTGPAAILVAQAGDNQAANAGQQVPIAPSVRVTDVNGNPVGGIAVTFAVASGGGSITGANQSTIASGVATVGSWTLGTVAGVNTLTATSAGLTGSPLTFTATGNPGNAANLTLNGGNGQTGTVGATLGTAISVLVTDNLTNPVQGVTVSWTAANGGQVNCGAGNVPSCSSLTNVNGVASASWVLGTTPGAQTATGAVGGLIGSPVTFNATANVGPPAIIVKTAGDNQTATVNTQVAVAPAVTVTDQFGNPVSGVTVTFAPIAGSGSVTGGTQITGGTGLATVGSWTLGTAAGNDTLNATVAGVGTAKFLATAIAGAATQIVINAGNGQSATVNTTVAIDPSVVVRDAFNNPVGGVTVTFTPNPGSGSVTGGTQSTSALGIATVTSWTLGTTAGTNTLQASAAGVGSVNFTATGTAGGVTTINPNGVFATSATVNTALSTNPSVIALDQFNNPVPTVAITFTRTLGNGTVNCGAGATVGCNVTTNASGIATVTNWIMGTVAGTNNNSLSATRAGATGTSFTASATPGTVSFFSLNSTNNQTQRPNFTVTSAPSVIARDAFSNPVPTVTVTFTVTAGSGLVNCGAGNVSACNVTTNASGIATVTSWIVSNGGVPSTGTYTNTLVASSAGATSLTFTATARWSFASDVQPIFTGNCAGCHPPNQPNLGSGFAYGAIRGVAAACAGQTYVVIGLNTSASSYLYQKIISASPACGVRMPPSGPFLTAATSNIIRDWIDNNSPPN